MMREDATLEVHLALDGGVAGAVRALRLFAIRLDTYGLGARGVLTDDRGRVVGSYRLVAPDRRVYAGMYVEGDGRVVTRTGVSRLFATREAAAAAGYRAGRIREYVLNDEAEYVGGDW